MGLLDLFSGNAGRNAAIATQQNLAGTLAGVNTMMNQGSQQGYDFIQQAQPQALGALAQGYGQASDLYAPYAGAGQQGFNMYANALGLNGPEGNAAATSAFQAGPGYQYAVDQSTDALARKASSLGTMGGGNTMAGISDRAGQMANQEYGNWLARLQGIGQTGYNATAAQAGAAQGLGTGTASIYQDDAARQAGIASNTSALGINALTDLGKLSAQNTNSGMLAGQTADQNSLNALLGVLGLGAKVATAPVSGGGSLLGNYFK
jgi:hypothetical protein